MSGQLYHRVVTGLFIALAAVSLMCSTHLLLLEYLRFLICGVALALVFVALHDTFMQRYACLCLLAGGYAYMVQALDPAVSGVAVFSTPAPALNMYRVVSLILVATAAVWWLVRAVRAAGSWADWLAELDSRDRYALGALFALGMLLALLEVLRAVDTQTSIVQALLRATKWCDWCCIYLAIVCGFRDTSQAPEHNPHLLVYTFLVFCGAVSVLGGLRATQAYYQARIPEKIDIVQGSRRLQLLMKAVTPREQLLKVFSLNSREALLVFEAGYYAGLQDREKYRMRMRGLQKFPRPAVQELDVMEELTDGNYAAAVRALEQFPLTYQFSTLNQQRAHDIMANMDWAAPGSIVDYVRGLLTLRCGDPTNAAPFFAQYTARVTNHANAAYFLRATGGTTAAYPHVSILPASGWLESITPGKPLQEAASHVTLLYNLTARGVVWVPTGAYTIAVWARDDGTPWERARAAGFDPACKVRVTTGDSTAYFTVLSTNRSFTPYTFTTCILNEPDRVLVEFANDSNDPGRGWDRNLSISHVEFIQHITP